MATSVSSCRHLCCLQDILASSDRDALQDAAAVMQTFAEVLQRQLVQQEQVLAILQGFMATHVSLHHVSSQLWNW